MILNTHIRRHRIERSYLVDGNHSQTISDKLELLDLVSYSEALGCERLRLPADKGYVPDFYPLITLAKLEAELLYPNNQMVIVALNSLLGPGSTAFGFGFAGWFRETREEEAASKLRRTLASESKALRAEAKLRGELALQTKISNFRRTLLEVLQSNIGYTPSELKGVKYYNLGFDPRQLLKSRSIDTLQLMMQDLSDSRRLWESITACMKGLEIAPSMDLKIPIIKYKTPLRLLGFGGCNQLDTKTGADLLVQMEVVLEDYPHF
jgi:hypothetical protein